LAKLVHSYESRLFAQLTPGNGLNAHWRLLDSGFKPVSASEVFAYWRQNVIARALTSNEIKELVEAFGNAAELLKEAGIDGIELQGYGGYLLDEFTTARWNKRTDEYGGSLHNRLRFPIELLNAIKDKVGGSFPVIYRYSVKHYIKGSKAGALRGEDYVEVGRDIDEGLEMAKLLEEAGFDALNINAGCHDSWYWAYPPTYQPHGSSVHLAAEVKRLVKIPVIAVGRLDIPEVAEKVIKQGKADIVALGRALLADPSWPNKVRHGRIDDIRPCIGCNDGCIYRIVVDQEPLSCTVNPACVGTKIYLSKRADKPKRVLIAGGGIAGMEAARSAALKGDEVILYERGENLGGHLIAGSVPEFKNDIKRLLDWYDIQLRRLKIKICFRTEVTVEHVKEDRPDRVIVATGSRAIIPDIPRIENPIVATCVDLLLAEKKAGETVAVIGGGLVGCETALWLANQGRRVIIIEALPEMMVGRIFYANKAMLLDLLKEKKVEFVTDASLGEVQGDGISIIERNSINKIIKCDTVALALGLEPNKELYQSLRDQKIELYAIGDCKEPGKIIDAIWDAYYVNFR